MFSGGGAGEYLGINNLITLRSSFQNAIEDWVLPLAGTADLQGVAQVPQPPTKVSEPASLAVLGVGLLSRGREAVSPSRLIPDVKGHLEQEPPFCRRILQFLAIDAKAD